MNRPTALLTGLALSLSACASWTTPVPRDQPYFQIDAKDAKTFQALAARQEHWAAKCAESNSCDHVYFTQALLGLYESRDAAEQYFRKVIAVAPKSHLAASSKTWMQLLQKHAVAAETTWGEAVLTAPALADANMTLAQAADRLVRELLARELMVQQLRGTKESDAFATDALSRELLERDHPSDPLSTRKDDPKSGAEPASVSQLRKQIVERDKKIAELSNKLEALKRIDQEMREKVRPIRPPAPGPETPQ